MYELNILAFLPLTPITNPMYVSLNFLLSFFFPQVLFLGRPGPDNASLHGHYLANTADDVEDGKNHGGCHTSCPSLPMTLGQTFRFWGPGIFSLGTSVLMGLKIGELVARARSVPLCTHPAGRWWSYSGHRWPRSRWLWPLGRRSDACPPPQQLEMEVQAVAAGGREDGKALGGGWGAVGGAVGGGQLQEGHPPCSELLSANPTRVVHVVLARRCRTPPQLPAHAQRLPGFLPVAPEVCGDWARQGHVTPTPTATWKGQTTLGRLAWCSRGEYCRGARPSGNHSPVASALRPGSWREGGVL